MSLDTFGNLARIADPGIFGPGLTGPLRKGIVKNSKPPKT